MLRSILLAVIAIAALTSAFVVALSRPATAQTTCEMGVFMVAASWCAACHQAAPFAAAIAQAQGVPIVLTTDDGRSIAPFDRALINAGHPYGNVAAYPTFIAVDLQRRRPVAQFQGFRDERSFIAGFLSLLKTLKQEAC